MRLLQSVLFCPSEFLQAEDVGVEGFVDLRPEILFGRSEGLRSLGLALLLVMGSGGGKGSKEEQGK